MQHRRIALVLSGGGATGVAFHADVLAGLQADLGWDARQATRIIGTSAGSIVGALLGRGVAPDDIAALVVSAPAHHPTQAAAEMEAPDLRSSVRSAWRHAGIPRVAAATAGFRNLLRRLDPLPLLSSVMRSGSVDLAPSLSFLDGGRWPSRLWVCAADARDLSPVIIGRDFRAPLGAAVAASCAVPGIVEPVELAGRQLVDGGAVSMFHADQLCEDRRPDLVIVSSPLSGWRVSGIPLGAPLARFCTYACEQSYGASSAARTSS